MVTEITWNNSAEHIPPEDDYVICKSYVSDGTVKYHRIYGMLFNLTVGGWEWTPYTTEKWKELNK